MYLKLQEIKLSLLRHFLLGLLSQKQPSSEVNIRIRLLLSCCAFVSDGLEKNLFIAAYLYSSLCIKFFVCTKRFLLKILFYFFLYNTKISEIFSYQHLEHILFNCGILIQQLNVPILCLTSPLWRTIQLVPFFFSLTIMKKTAVNIPEELKRYSGIFCQNILRVNNQQWDCWVNESLHFKY